MRHGPRPKKQWHRATWAPARATGFIELHCVVWAPWRAAGIREWHSVASGPVEEWRGGGGGAPETSDVCEEPSLYLSGADPW
eukprot:3851414-Pyramimonas_sp.AAC.1